MSLISDALSASDHDLAERILQRSPRTPPPGAEREKPAPAGCRDAGTCSDGLCGGCNRCLRRQGYGEGEMDDDRPCPDSKCHWTREEHRRDRALRHSNGLRTWPVRSGEL